MLILKPHESFLSIFGFCHLYIVQMLYNIMSQRIFYNLSGHLLLSKVNYFTMLHIIHIPFMPQKFIF